MNFKEFLNYIHKAKDALLSYDGRDVILIFHDDADGISAGAIVYKSLIQLGYNVKLVCIEKLMDQIIRYIHLSNKNKIIFYVDIGSSHGDKISKYNKGNNLTIILDHHDPVAANDPMVYNVNPEFFGYEGERHASGSTVAYLFAKAIDPSNINLSGIALIGAQEIPGELSGLNLLVKEDFISLKISFDYKKMFSILQVLGSVGYYEGGPIIGVKACVEGLSKEIEDYAKSLEERRKAANKKMLSLLYRKGLKKGRYVQWFYDYNVYRGMGTKVIGTFCSYLSYQLRLIDPNKYILGYLDMPNEIPNLMRLEGNWVKVSCRAPKKLRAQIEAGNSPGISDFLVPMASQVGGIGDGHKFAASAVIPKERINEFMSQVDEYINNYYKR